MSFVFLENVKKNRILCRFWEYVPLKVLSSSLEGFCIFHLLPTLRHLADFSLIGRAHYFSFSQTHSTSIDGVTAYLPSKTIFLLYVVTFSVCLAVFSTFISYKLDWVPLSIPNSTVYMWHNLFLYISGLCREQHRRFFVTFWSYLYRRCFQYFLIPLV